MCATVIVSPRWDGVCEQTPGAIRVRSAFEPGETDLHALWQDIRYGFKLLVKNRGFPAVAMLSLGLKFLRSSGTWHGGMFFFQ